MPINTNYYEFTENAIKNKSNSVGNKITEFKIKKGQTVKFGLFLYSKPTQSTTFTFYKNEGDDFESFANFQTYTLNVKFEKTYTATEDTEIYIRMWGNADSEIFEFQLWAELDELTNYLKYEEQNYILDIQQEMLKGDYFVKESDGWKEVHGWNKLTFIGNENFNKSGSATDEVFVATLDIDDGIEGKGYSNYFKHSSEIAIGNFLVYNNGSNIRFCVDGTEIATIEQFKVLLQQKNSEGNPLCAFYKLATPTKLACTEEQSTVLDKLNNLDLFKNTNNIITTEDIALLKLKYVVDTKTYIDNQINERLSNIENQIVNLSGGN